MCWYEAALFISWAITFEIGECLFHGWLGIHAELIKRHNKRNSGEKPPTKRGRMDSKHFWLIVIVCWMWKTSESNILEADSHVFMRRLNLENRLCAAAQSTHPADDCWHDRQAGSLSCQQSSQTHLYRHLSVLQVHEPYIPTQTRLLLSSSFHLSWGIQTPPLVNSTKGCSFHLPFLSICLRKTLNDSKHSPAQWWRAHPQSNSIISIITAIIPCLPLMQANGSPIKIDEPGSVELIGGTWCLATVLTWAFCWSTYTLIWNCSLFLIESRYYPLVNYFTLFLKEQWF